jgi:F0F1-type ATP synthase membrane subunit b/b'
MIQLRNKIKFYVDKMLTEMMQDQEVKKEVGNLSIMIDEKLVKEKLNDNAAQQTLVDKLVNESMTSN